MDSLACIFQSISALLSVNLVWCGGDLNPRTPYYVSLTCGPQRLLERT